MPTTHISYTTGDSQNVLRYGDSLLAQSFTPSEAFVIYSVKVYMAKNSGTLSTDYATCTVYEADGDGFPTGGALTDAARVLGSECTFHGTYSYEEFIFSTTSLLASGTVYVFVMDNNIGISSRGFYYRHDHASATYSGGWISYSSDNGSSWSDPYATHDGDQLFEVLGTVAVTPTVTTQVVTAISGTIATGNGNITGLGNPNPTAHGVCWNTTGTPTTAGSKTDEGATSATGAFTTGITGLTAGTKYYVRAYATNDSGTGYGAEVVFWANKGTVYPTEAITRVTNLIHRYNRAGGVYTLEMNLGEVTSDFGLPQWLSKPQPLVEPEVEPRVPYPERKEIPITGDIPGVPFEPGYVTQPVVEAPQIETRVPYQERKEIPITGKIPGVEFQPEYIKTQPKKESLWEKIVRTLGGRPR